MPRLLLIAPKASYRTGSYAAAAERVDVEIVVASEGSNSLTGARTPGLKLNFQDLRKSLEQVSMAHSLKPFSGVIGTDDEVLDLASVVAKSLRLPSNPPHFVKTSARKDLSRKAQEHSGFPTPWFCRLDLTRPDFGGIPEDIPYPCVAKPVSLTASRGVIKVNNKKQLLLALERIRNIIRNAGTQHPTICLIEKYIPGNEYVLEGLLEQGTLKILAIFSKPNYMGGPFFEETIYISCPYLDSKIRTNLFDMVQSACMCYGLVYGPIHAECRINSAGVWLIELAARTIGGSCGKILDLCLSKPLEDIVILNALGATQTLSYRNVAVGVMMIPVPGRGILRRVEGIENAQNTNLIQSIEIDIQAGQKMIPWPEGSPYPGFIFAKGRNSSVVVEALRSAHAKLQFVLARELPIVVT